jgi:hypothetical protein
MPTIPTSVTSTPTEFQPAFTRVQQSENHDCAFACIAMIAGKTLEEIRELAVKKFMHPIHGPYWITGDLIAGLLAQNGYVASVYKEAEKIENLPDLAIAMVDYQPSTELGRHVLFHRAKASHAPTTIITYMIDPAYWVEPQEHIRTSFKGLPVSWFIAVHAMNKPGK